MTHFYEISYHTRVARLRRAAIGALELYGITPQRMKFISTFNALFRVTDSAGRRYNLKALISPHEPSGHRFVAPAWETAFGMELALRIRWQEALTLDTDLELAVPLRTQDDRLIPTIQVEGLPESVRCTLYTWHPGRVLTGSSKSWPGPDFTRQIGRIAATLHTHAQQ